MTRFRSERTGRLELTDPTERCSNCTARGFQHEGVDARCPTEYTLRVAGGASASVDKTAATLKRLMAATTQGAIVGRGNNDEAEKGRLTIPEAVRRSAGTAMSDLRRKLGQTREQLRAEEQQRRAEAAALGLPASDYIPNQLKDDFATYLGLPRATIDELEANIGPEELRRWIDKRESVKAAIESQREQERRKREDDERRAFREQQARLAKEAELRRQRNARPIALGEVYEFFDDPDPTVIFASRTAVRAGPFQPGKKPKPAAAPAVAIGAKRRYFDE